MRTNPFQTEARNTGGEEEEKRRERGGEVVGEWGMNPPSKHNCGHGERGINGRHDN